MFCLLIACLRPISVSDSAAGPDRWQQCIGSLSKPCAAAKRGAGFIPRERENLTALWKMPGLIQ
jgi:hypothetical protein